MIQVENLTRYYDDFCAVNGISLNISRGEILGLLGPNGAGKTTTLRMLTGYLRPTSGSIRVKGLSVDNDMLEIKRLLGYLPESAPLYPDMLVYDYLFYVAGLRGIDSSARLSRIRDMADMCAVNEVMHQPVAELSKGYKQRVGLAHALINDPEVLVLDEPTSGLDPNQIAEIRDIIPILHSIIGIYLPIAKQKSINLQFSHDAEQIKAKIDSDLLKIVVRNLLNNAVKFTPEHGKISLAVTHSETSVQISITDNGIGMSKREVQTLRRGIGPLRASNLRNGDGGVGLGFNLSRDALKKMKAKLMIDSIPDQGTTIKIQLPAK